ncbi:tetratricopeptide repeat protein [Halotia branconii]|uniref:Tetratricopeptide repeat protein n=1 Tax=Halotia branconii CENA392 TaxID=1539056 RepID=A0AAJ6NYI6_9CYAN|nr:hypothetical protein [Halotia branconii]WGV29098.1 hypothetical protein QI031_30300 [Halotia branconii CENA392]
MKNSTKFLVTLCFSFLLIKDTVLLAGVPLVRNKRNLVRCEPSGRIMSPGDKRFEVGSLICDGEKLEVLNGGSIKFLCFSTGEVVGLSSGVLASDKCAKPSSSDSACRIDSRNFCQGTRKGGEAGNNEPTIIYPYHIPTLKPRPEVAWLPVAGATSYEVRFECHEFAWERVVNQTRLAYPLEEKALVSGQTCRIIVFAYKNDNVTSADQSVVYLLPEDEAKRIKDVVEQINQLKLSPDETALDLDAVFISRNLFDETLKELNNVVASGTKNPTIYRVLGDRYFQAGVPDKAKRQYLIALQFLKTNRNPTELRKVQEGLKIVDYYNQLPTSR